METKQRTGAAVLVDCLIKHGVKYIFGIPGESYLAVLEELRGVQDRIRYVQMRHEGGAGFAADAAGKLDGVGVGFVSRWPGATNFSIGLATAFEDSTAMVLFIGQVDRAVMGRESFQEADYHLMFGKSKGVFEVGSADKIEETVSKAFHLATSGRRGPVVVSLPHDIFLDMVSLVPESEPLEPVASAPTDRQMKKFAKMLKEAERPLLIVGGSGWTQEAIDSIGVFAVSHGLPVVTASRRNDLFDNKHSHYAGCAGVSMNPALAERIKKADLIIAVGSRLDEMTTGRYTLIKPPVPEQKLIHVHASPGELGRVFKAQLLINSAVAEFAQSAVNLPAATLSDERKIWLGEAHSDYIEFLKPQTMPGDVQLAEVVTMLQKQLPEGSIITNGAGNSVTWLHRYYQYRKLGTQLGPVCGAMGYAVPAAIAAKLARPDAVVVSWSGDGCFQMNMQDLIIASAYKLPVVFIVINNGMYGTIRMHQERAYPCHEFATDLVDPDFMKLAEAYRAFGQAVSRTEEFEQALKLALAHTEGPSLIEIRVAKDSLIPSENISAHCDLTAAPAKA